ncbi:MAG: NarK/NasA family nitrate transporter [Deltaproteobacteria bacterium]|nr:NarK/NasA family nitrate transporter [Deltaproteobacteria bacterium]
MPASVDPSPQGNSWQLTLGTGAFAVCFAVFGSVSALMPFLRKQLALTPMQASVAIALPVLLGSLGRIPLGMLTDRLGGRRIFIGTMAASVLSVLALSQARSFPQLVAAAFLVGIALASFSVGVGFVSGWYPPARQGTALGIYGAGNAGQSIAAFSAPFLARAVGVPWAFAALGGLCAVWLVLFSSSAKDAPRVVTPRSLADTLRPLADPKSWHLSLYYFLTFGGFVAMAIYLPTFLTDLFQLSAQDAGMRTAGFVVVATAMRPLGGSLADRIGGRTILLAVFPAVAAMAALLCIPGLVAFSIGALGMAAAIGLGNGAVFKLVPEQFPKSVGAVTGLVGAAGGLGGFFPPLLLGGVRQAVGTFTLGFVLLGGFAIACLVVLIATGPKRATPQPALAG